MTAIFAAASQRILLGAGVEKRTTDQTQPESPSDCLDRILPNDEDGLKSIWSFRDEVTPYFPFVVLPADQTVSELRQKRPFLFSTIGMVTCYDDAARQLEMIEIINKHIGNVILLKGELNLDVLQGLLVCLSWCACLTYITFLQPQLRVTDP
jgi:hypothetical protein